MATKSPDEIKKGLDDPIPVHFHKGDPEPRITHFNYHALERLHSETLAYIQQLEVVDSKVETTTVPRWISVEESLPEDGEDVLVHVKYSDDVSDTKVAHRVMKKWYLRVAHRVGGVVTHWMPLPEPPKEVPGENGKL